MVIALAFLLVMSLWLTTTLSATESGLHIAQTMRIEPTRLYAADGALERVIQDMRYDPTAGRWDDTCDTSVTLQDPPQTVFVRCEPDGNSGRADEGESSPPIGIIGLSNGASNEFAYQQYENSVVRIDGGVYSNTPVYFQDTANIQLNLCPRNEKTINDGIILRNSRRVTSLSARFVAGDVDVPIVGSGIPSGTTISSVAGPSAVDMSRAATSTGIRVIRFRQNYPPEQRHCFVPNDLEDPGGEHRRKGKITAVPRTPGGESCDQSHIVSLQFNCDSNYVPDPVGNDPNYPVDKSSGFSFQTVPSCGDPANYRPVELQPGRYNNAAALTTLTTTCDKVIWFKPGVYYFDFEDAGARVWTIGASSLPNLTVVGGAKTWRGDPFLACVRYSAQTNRSTVTASSAVFQSTDANSAWINAGYNLPYKAKIRSVTAGGTVATFDGPPLTNNFGDCNTDANNPKPGIFTVSPVAGTFDSLGSLCDPRTNTSHAGVEFVFGNDSRMLINDGKTEICSPVTGTQQQIAMYGVKTQQAQLRPQSGCIVAQPYTKTDNAVCAMVKAPQGSKAAFLVHGTIYAPKAAIDLTLQGVGYQVVSRGIIARVIALTISPSAVFTDPLIYSPNFGSVPGAPRKMVLTACLIAHCDDPGSKPKIRTVVRMQDSDDNNNAGVPGFKVLIDSWSVL